MSFESCDNFESDHQEELDFPSVGDVKEFFAASDRPGFADKIDDYSDFVHELVSEASKEKRNKKYEDYVSNLSSQELRENRGFLQVMKAGIDRMLESNDQ